MEIESDLSIRLTDAEIKAGYHFCAEFDGALVGPGAQRSVSCICGAPGALMAEYEAGGDETAF